MCFFKVFFFKVHLQKSVPVFPITHYSGIMYGSSKIHKPLVNGFPKLRPILSALNTGTYKWAKFFVPLLRHLTSNQFTLKDSFEFAKIICEQDAGLFMASLDVDSLFTNVPLEETIHICVNELFKSNSSIHGLKKTNYRDALFNHQGIDYFV